ncbi:Acetyltransferase (GNAT) family protein [Phycisphaerae bacterium RAS1]|nr:Acetyltransferase (GNAT) family protein [Phycisphaerae bacterium RAS1]
MRAMADTITTAAIRRSNQRYFEQVCTRETIPQGYAYFQPAHPLVSALSFLGEAVIETGDSREAVPAARGADAAAAVNAFFARRGAACSAWIPAAQQPVDAFSSFLPMLGYERREWTCLGRPPTAAIEDVPAAPYVRVLPARAMRRAYTAAIAARFGDSSRDAETASAMTALHLDRLNDAGYDAFVALADDQPAGTAALFQVGEIGRVCDVFVMPALRRRGVGRELLRHALAAARRWLLHPTCAAVDARNATGRALLEQAGFVADGTIPWFALPGVELGGA